MHTHDATLQRLVLIRVDPGEDLLDALERAVAERGVRNGAFISGAGSLSRYRFHVVSTARMPPENDFVESERLYDVLAVTGFVLDGRVHAHSTFADNKIAIGGYLEPGCEVLTFDGGASRNRRRRPGRLGFWARG